MAILEREISKRVKGSLAESEDWWRLCYDTESGEFYVKHKWHHSNAYNISQPADEGTEIIALDGYTGAGSEKIDEAKAALLERAGGT